jgi:NAD(P)-dependent dehydrogenase (short-subunit alcohol dehydrogenase family)
MAKRLAGKCAVVVGAGQTPGPTIGNGRAIAQLFAEEGAKVYCVDRSLERAAETAEIIREGGGEAEGGQADVVKAQDCERVLKEARERLGGFDVLVNNVGVLGAPEAPDGPAHLASEAGFDRIIEINLKGTFLMTRAALALLRPTGGTIVNISSLSSIAGGGTIAYEASKAGVNRLTLSTAASNAKYGVRCNAILPGLMDTPMAVSGTAAARDRSEEEVRAQRASRVPLKGGMGSAWDTAYAALFLASDEAKFITGVLLPVDGGMSSRVG